MNKLNKIIIYVRTPEEFSLGLVNGSLNLSLQEIGDRIDEVKSYNQTILLCCASGNRSGQASMFLKTQEVDCEDGSSWRDVERMIQN